MTAQEILDEIAENFDSGAKRRFLPGLLISFIWLLQDLKATSGKFSSLKDFYATHNRQTTTSSGVKANTLIVLTGQGNKTVSIRKFYDQIQNWFRAEKKRFDYPSAAPHATQAWQDYAHWMESLLSMNDDELDSLVESAKSFVLERLPEQDLAAKPQRREPRYFHLFLENFNLAKQKGEATGAAYQGTVFGYIRADAAHLQVDVGKVRSGSKRVGRVGDIDAREGDVLVITAEVKQFHFKEDNLSDVAEFAKLVAQHMALGLVVALDFDNGVREKLRAMGLEPVSRHDLAERVRLWDPLKQKIATQALIYYAQYKEQNSALLKRVRDFFHELETSSQ